jgi:hypothetical protein
VRAYRCQRVLTSSPRQIMYTHHTSSHLCLLWTLVLWSGCLRSLHEVKIHIDGLVLDLIFFLYRQLELVLRLIQGARFAKSEASASSFSFRRSRVSWGRVRSALARSCFQSKFLGNSRASETLHPPGATPGQGRPELHHETSHVDLHQSGEVIVDEAQRVAQLLGPRPFHQVKQLWYVERC